jgi:hypothetical protein
MYHEYIDTRVLGYIAVFFLLNNCFSWGPFMFFSSNCTPRVTSALILLVTSRRGKSYWLISSFAHIFVVLATSRWPQVFLFVHSKCLGNCLMRIYNMAGAALLCHTIQAPRAAQQAFMM